MRRAASLTSCRRPCWLTTSTPSIMPLRMASIRARSAASSLGALRQLADRIIEEASDRADLVAASVAGGTAEVSGGITLRRGGNRLHPAGQQRGAEPRQQQRRQRADAECDQRHATDGLPVAHGLPSAAARAARRRAPASRDSERGRQRRACRSGASSCTGAPFRNRRVAPVCTSGREA